MHDQTLNIPVKKDKWNEVLLHGEYPFDMNGLWTTVSPITDQMALKLLDDGVLCNKAYRVLSFDRWGGALAVYLHDFHYYLIKTDKLEEASNRAWNEVNEILSQY